MTTTGAENLQLLSQDYAKDNCIITASTCRNH